MSDVEGYSDGELSDYDGGDDLDDIPEDENRSASVRADDTDDEASGAESAIEEEAQADVIDESVPRYSKEIVVVAPENRITSHILSKFEMTELISIRATQIAEHGKCMVNVEGLDDPIKKAEEELRARKCPLVLRRYLGDMKNPETGEMESYYEFWDPNSMVFSDIFD